MKHTRKFLKKQELAKKDINQQSITCPKCKGTKASTAKLCRVCTTKAIKAEKQRRYWQTHPDARVLKNRRLRETSLERKQYYEVLRRNVLTHYGDGRLACVQCGFDMYEALDIDHIEGVKKYIGEAKHHGKQLIFWLDREGYPDGFQTLCRNCNWLKWIEARDKTKLDRANKYEGRQNYNYG